MPNYEKMFVYEWINKYMYMQCHNLGTNYRSGVVYTVYIYMIVKAKAGLHGCNMAAYMIV